jgi:Rps23 Pro-64 3,4-dihydroxylase Tpa1-like proline 4-hydroxylase
VSHQGRKDWNVREVIVAAIIERLHEDSDRIRTEFSASGSPGIRFAAIDNLLPDALARTIFAAFPPLEHMRLLDSFREKKFTSKALDTHDPLISDITFAFQDPRVVDLVADLTGIKEPHPDPKLYAGGISAMVQGHFLNPHLDNSHDSEQRLYRVLNLLYYCSPDWKADDGGNLELWNEAVTEAVEIPSLFNRLVLMSTNDKSWHSVNEVRRDGKRCCISNYYFSRHSPNGYETTHVTYFKARPEQKVRRLWTEADSRLRTVARIIKKRGFSKKDLFEPKQ